jgi:hypothetical protein
MQADLCEEAIAESLQSMAQVMRQKITHKRRLRVRVHRERCAESVWGGHLRTRHTARMRVACVMSGSSAREL